MGRMNAIILSHLGYLLLLLQGPSLFVQAQDKADPILPHDQHRDNNVFMTEETWPNRRRSSESLLDSDNEDCSTDTLFELEIQFDEFAYEAYWFLDSYNYEYHSWGYYYNDSTIMESSFCIPPGTYTFKIYDSADDGLCCDFGLGYYKISLDGVLVHEGGNYGSEELISFEAERRTLAPTQAIAPTVSPTVICASNEVMLSVELKLDFFPGTMSWNLTDLVDTLIISSEEIRDEMAFARLYREYCISHGVYIFTIYDSMGYGLHTGNYNVSIDGNSIFQGGDFSSTNQPHLQHQIHQQKPRHLHPPFKITSTKCCLNL